MQDSPLLKAALEYTARGWPVFPCRARAKVPLTPTGFKAATTNSNTVKAWWQRWPDANIGMPTGIAFVVVDIDEHHGGGQSFDDLESKHGKVPDTVMSMTGGGGIHHLFKVPAYKYPNSAGALGPGIDTRGHGGYIIVPPSIHESGKTYEWELSSTPESTELADLPGWLQPNKSPTLDKGKGNLNFEASPLSQLKATGDPVEKGRRNTSCASLVGQYLTQGISIVEIMELCNVWNKANPNPLPSSEIERTVASVARTHVNNHPAAQIRLYREEPVTEAPIGVRIPQSFSMAISESSLNPPGFVGDLMRWIIDTAIFPQPELALANSLSFFGAVIGRKVRTPTDLRSNLYCLGVGESGCGKDHSRKAIKHLCTASGISDKILGGEDFSSDSAIISAVSSKPTVLFQLDEIGHLIENIKLKYAPSHIRNIMVLLTKLYSSASTRYLGKEYADQKINPRKDIIQPNVCIYGTTVPSKLYSAITPDEVRDGFLGRLLVFHSMNPDPDPCKRMIADVPDSLVASIQGWWSRKDLPVADGNVAMHLENNPILVPFEEDAEKVFDDFGRYSRVEKKKCRDGSGLDALWSRSLEHAQKIALIIASGCQFQTPIVSKDIAEYSVELVAKLTANLVHDAREHVSDTVFGRDALKVLSMIRKTGKTGLIHSEIVRHTQGMKPRDRADVLDSLISGEVVTKVNFKPKGPGRPGIRYYAI